MTDATNLMRRQAMGILFALLTTLALATKVRADDFSVRTLAIVNGDTISAAMLVEELGRIHTAQATPTQRGNFNVESLLQKLINNRLIVQDARASALDQDADVLATVREFSEAAAYEALLRNLALKSNDVSAEFMNATYEEYFINYKLRLVCVNDESLANTLLDSIHLGTPMAEIAARHSIDRFKESGGDGGFYALARVPEDLQSRLRACKVGDVIGPLYLWRVWTIMRIEEIRAADESERDSAQTEVLTIARSRQRKAQIKILTDSLQQIVDVNVDSSMVDSVIVLMRAGLPADERPVITVANTRTLSANELRRKYIHRISGRTDREAHNVLMEVVRDQVDMLLLKEAAARFMNTELQSVALPVQAFEDSILIVTYLADIIGAVDSVSDQQILSYYNEHPDAFRTRGQLRIATITKESDSLARDTYEKIRAGSDFDWMARRESEDELRESGGVRDWMKWGEFPPSWQPLLDTLRVGGVLPPQKVEHGYWIIKLIDREPDGILLLSTVKEQIRQVIHEQLQLEAIERTVSNLRTSADIFIDQDAMEQVRIAKSSP